MSDDSLAVASSTEPYDPDLLPFEEGAEGDEGTRRSEPVAAARFLYLGQGLTAAEFEAYVATYDFGTIPPDFVVLHHTAIPGTRHAGIPGKAVWDAGEDGLSEAQIKERRARKVLGLREFYRLDPKLLWDRGPHLFIDDRWIWLFTPMRDIGIHAAQGNSLQRGGKLHYSIGIEVVGYYEHVTWPEPVARLVGHAVAVLKRRLGNFELRHRAFAGGISSHRDYNKPQCPGRAISEDYYIRVLREGWERLTQPAPIDTETEHGQAQPRPAGDAPLLGAASGPVERIVAYIEGKLAPDSEYRNDVALIAGYYWKYAPGVGIDPFLAATQCVFETDSLRSHWAGRPRRNPAGLGVHDEGGLSFASWDEAVQAHIGQLLAYAVSDEQASEGQRAMMRRNPRFERITVQQRGAGPTVRSLAAAVVGNPGYADLLLGRMNNILNG